MADKVYRSSLPDIPILDSDLVSYLFTDEVGISPSFPIYIDGVTGATRTYADIKQRTQCLATGLRNLGVKPNDIVAFFSPNTIDYAIISYAILGCNATVSPVNAASTATELQVQLTTSGAVYLIAHSILLPAAIKAAKNCPALQAVIQADGPSPLSPLPPSPPTAEYLATHTPPTPLLTIHPTESTSRLALMCFSSGTTGLPKGVMTTHSNMVANVQQWRAHSPHLTTKSSTWIAFLPFSHIYGLNYFLCLPVKLGCTAVVMPRFDMPLYLHLIEKYRPDTLAMVPPVLLGLVNAPIVTSKKYDLSSVKTMVCAAAPLGPEMMGAVARKWDKEWGVKLAVLQAWGLTETSPAISFVEEQHAEAKRGSVGSLVPNCEVRVVNPETMVDVPRKEDGGSTSGEFWVRGPNICIGYYRNEEATRNGFHVDEEGKRWFRTGDIGTVDRDGYIWIVDRMKEMIKYKGFQVIPAEMEAKLLEHPDVVDACVFGVYIAQMATEVPVGFVVLRPQAVKRSEEAAAEVKAWLEARVAGHKKFRGGLHAVESVPKSPSGKILRRQLKAEWEHRIKQVVEGASARL